MKSKLQLTWSIRFHQIKNSGEAEVPGEVRRIMTLEPYADGLGIMRDAQTAKPQSFVTGDGWFVYNLAVNLAEM